ncbi:MAG: hypothetical protein JST31_13150 [Actinobacteria bacterium]|nr:hypothetical protein [Actinomycetota bacterium]
MSADAEQLTGAWAERGAPDDYMHEETLHCGCCGRMIVRRAWVVTAPEEPGGELIFCEPVCERIYAEYWLPRHGGGR